MDKNKKKLEKEHATPQSTGVRNLSDKFAIAGVTPQKMGAIIKAACGGDIDDFFTIAEEIEERDAHYRSVLQTRKLATRKLKASINFNSEDEKQAEFAEILNKQINRPSFRCMLGDLMDAISKGYSIVEMCWDIQLVPWQVREFKWRDPRLFQLSGPEQEIRIKDDKNKDGLELPLYNFIIHQPPLKSGLKSRAGLAMPMVWSYLFKNYTIKDWMAFIEVYGQPVRLGTYGADASEEDIEELIKAVVNIGSDATAVIPQNMNIEIKESSSRAANAAIFKDLAEYMDKQISKLILGQTMTTDDGSSQSQATVHDEVREDILTADGQDMADTINQYYIKPWIDLNFGVQEEYPVFKLELIEPEDTKAKLEAITQLMPLGLPISKNQIYQIFGLHQPEDAEDTLIFGQAAASQNKRLETALNLAFNNHKKAPDQPQELADEIGDHFLKNWEEQAEGLIEPVVKLIEKCDSYDDFLKELEELKLDSTALQIGLEQAGLTARALGDVQDSLTTDITKKKDPGTEKT